MDVNSERIWSRINKIAEIGSNTKGGIDRFAFSDEDIRATNLVLDWMKEIGLKTWRDCVGNVFGRLEGIVKSPVTLIGSHLDSVPDGGKFDGVAGVVAALEVLQVMKEKGIINKYPTEMVIFINEEGSRFPGGLMGSMAITGKLPKDYPFYIRDREGVLLAKAMGQFGLQPERILEAKRNDIKRFFELHIEQAPVLENYGYPVGIVTGIAGPYQMKLKICGQTGHAGAMPMLGRRDPMVAAGIIIKEVERTAIEAGETTRGTVGYVHVQPGGHNVIPAFVEMTLDYRDINLKTREYATKRIKHFIKNICAERNLSYELTITQDSPPIIINDNTTSLLHETAKEQNIPHIKIVSGAAHDAMVMASHCDVGMIFVRSQNGLSHCKEEFSSKEDLALATELLFHSMVKC